jgi:poly(3-hydroxyalkanoate) depolymerase
VIRETEFVRAGSLRLRISRSGTGPPLLLINGLGANLEMWKPFAQELRGLEVISFDLPGAGRSETARWPMRMPQLARTVVALLDALDHPTVDVLGYSLGGVIAQEIAHRAPERVGRLVLSATFAGVPSVPPAPWVAFLMLTPARYYSRRLAKSIVPIIAGGRTARDRGLLHAGLDLRLAQPPSLLGYAQQLWGVSGWSSHLWLRRLRHRTLVLHGDDDPLVPLINARYLAAAIPRGRLHVVKGGGHLFLFDDPLTAVAPVQSFLSLA